MYREVYLMLTIKDHVRIVSGFSCSALADGPCSFAPAREEINDVYPRHSLEKDRNLVLSLWCMHTIAYCMHISMCFSVPPTARIDAYRQPAIEHSL